MVVAKAVTVERLAFQARLKDVALRGYERLELGLHTVQYVTGK